MVFAILILVVTLPFTIFVIRSTPEQMGLHPYGATDQESAAAEAATTSADTGSKGKKSSEPAASTVGMTASQALRSPAFWALAIFCGLITMNQTIYQFLPSYAASLPSMAAYTGLIASSCVAGQAIGKVILGMVNDGSIVGWEPSPSVWSTHALQCRHPSWLQPSSARVTIRTSMHAFRWWAPWPQPSPLSSGAPSLTNLTATSSCSA